MCLCSINIFYDIFDGYDFLNFFRNIFNYEAVILYVTLLPFAHKSSKSSLLYMPRPLF